MRLIDADKLEIRKLAEFNDEYGDAVPVYGVAAEDIDNALAVAASMPRWISAGERLPPAYIRVYAVIKGADDAIIAWVDDKGRWDDDESWTYEKIVTHWMPLPELPEVKLCEND